MKTKVAILIVVSSMFLSGCSLIEPEDETINTTPEAIIKESPSPTPSPLINKPPTEEPKVKGPQGKLPPVN